MKQMLSKAVAASMVNAVAIIFILTGSPTAAKQKSEQATVKRIAATQQNHRPTTAQRMAAAGYVDISDTDKSIKVSLMYSWPTISRGVYSTETSARPISIRSRPPH